MEPLDDRWDPKLAGCTQKKYNKLRIASTLEGDFSTEKRPMEATRPPLESQARRLYSEEIKKVENGTNSSRGLFPANELDRSRSMMVGIASSRAILRRNRKH